MMAQFTVASGWTLMGWRFCATRCHVSKLQLETRELRTITENLNCPDCVGSGSVPMHGGLRQKECPRCRGRGWIAGKRAW